MSASNLNFLLLNIDSRKVCVTDGGFYHLEPATIHKNICDMLLRKTVQTKRCSTLLYLREKSSNRDKMKPFPAFVRRHTSQERKGTMEMVSLFL